MHELTLTKSYQPSVNVTIHWFTGSVFLLYFTVAWGIYILQLWVQLFSCRILLSILFYCSGRLSPQRQAPRAPKATGQHNNSILIKSNTSEDDVLILKPPLPKPLSLTELRARNIVRHMSVSTPLSLNAQIHVVFL